MVQAKAAWALCQEKEDAMAEPAHNIIELGPHDKMTPDEALAYARREPWERVIVVGFHDDHGGLVVRSSHMSREQALWIAESLKLHAMDML